MRIVLDSNVIIAAFATRGLCSEIFELCLYEHEIITSANMLQEIEKGLSRKVRLPPHLVSQIKEFLISNSGIVIPSAVPPDSCRDPDDLEVLGVAISANANAIVTGDDDLLVIERFCSIPVYSPRAFWQIMHKNR